MLHTLQVALVLELSTLSNLFEIYGRILKANLSWTRKKSNSSCAKIFLFVSFFFCTKSRTSVLKFEFFEVKLG